ncbi:MAG TPA: DUF294 nucleotidyltransferase-like domain-containing protein [Intrasporangium sp.]|uniref:DUF294 nucleotidyltransferase-like domain-containing protein n=1 Tax=Intrasporangium sp. TaxID=1925024 RepID=UPI002D76A6BB|nr:DUF294 nucleotidyltransferase-like domain-containing protein [Intrasporangium sp.]HET7398851.1 DUF294 nucleotidyltransferase-like domain-containing protein [Intrasporangium sp.]
MTDVEISEVVEFLADQAPWAVLGETELRSLSRRLSIRYARRGTALMTVGAANDEVFVVRSGAVQVDDDSGRLVERCGEGGSFGTTTLDGSASRFAVTAIEDALLLVVPGPVFREVTSAHPAVAEFFSEQRATRLRRALETVHAAQRGAELQTPVGDLVRRPPVAAAGHTTIREAAATMAREGVSSLLVVDGGRLVGIVTDRDLRNRVLASGRDPGDAVQTIMTAEPVVAAPDDRALDVVLRMTSRNIHHVPVVRGDEPVGMVTSSDVLQLAQADPVALVGEAAKQRDVAGLARIASRLPEVVERLVASDAPADGVARIVTAVGDAIARRLLVLAEESLGPAPAAYCWVVLGSQARLEQGLGSDQDNALVVADDADPADAPWFEALARFVVDGLVECGYPRCPGDVMATNPAWRQPLAAWRRLFAGWLHAPVPEAVLRSAIFFDLRALHGDPALLTPLQRLVQTAAPQSGRFLAHLAKHAVANEPPLGFFRGFVLEREGQHRATLDLKRGGVGAVVELARVLALSRGLPHVGTAARITAAAGAGAIDPRAAADLRDAYEFIRHVRLTHQARQVRAGLPPDNFVAPSELSGFDKRHLRDAFAVVRTAQHTLARSYSLGFVS